MTEPGFREIQLSTKQVVFLFMAFVVVAVGIFLLGVSVGRGVSTGQVSADARGAAEPTVEVLPATPSTSGAAPPQADKLTYHEGLQKAPPPSPMADAPPDTTPTPTPAAPVTKPAATGAKNSAPTTAAKPAPTAKTVGTLYLQVDSFSSADNARRQIAKLKAQGFSTAFVFEASGSGAKYKTRVGPFVNDAERDAAFAKLRKEGYKPSPIR